jgi:hypothetical protein
LRLDSSSKLIHSEEVSRECPGYKHKAPIKRPTTLIGTRKEQQRPAKDRSDAASFSTPVFGYEIFFSVVTNLSSLK